MVIRCKEGAVIILVDGNAGEWWLFENGVKLCKSKVCARVSITGIVSTI